MHSAETIPIIEEEARVEARSIETGRVRVETKTSFVREMAEAELESREVEVVRVSVNRQVESAPDIRTEGDVTIIPVLEEVLVVEKRLVLKEELHVKRLTKTETVAVPVDLRRQEATVTREPAADPTRNARNTAMSLAENYSDRTITAFFDSRDDAQEAIDRLKGLGIPDGSVKLVRGDDETFTDREDHRGFWESLSDFFFPDDDRAAYAEGLRRGGFLVTATGIPSDKYDEAIDILDDEGSVDVDARASEWRSEGWSGTDTYRDTATSASAYGTAGTGVASTYGAGIRSTAGETDIGGTAAVGSARTSAAYDADLDAARTARADTDFFTDEAVTSSAEPIASDAARLDTDAIGSRTDYGRTGDEEVIPVTEERLRVGKRDTDLGRVRVRAYTVEEPVSESVNLRDEKVFVERRPVDRALSAADTAFTDRTIEATEHREEAVVSKEARVKEEIALRKEANERTETVSDTVRRTEVEIEDERDDEIRREGTTGTFTDKNRL